MLKRGVIYARVSSDDHQKGGLNLCGQVNLCQGFAKARGYSIVAELLEDERGVSGAAPDSPALLQALEMAHRHEFDVLVVREIDRLARSLAKQLTIEQEFKQYGVEIEYALETYQDSPEGHLHKHIKAVIAEYERLKITERTVRGRRQKVKKGNILVHGKPPYGYRLVEDQGRSSLKIFEPEARIVRLIFTWYVQGDDDHGPLSGRKIALRLSAAGIPAPDPTRSKHHVWAARTVTHILASETYAGIWYYGKFSQQSGHKIANSEDKWLPVQTPAIIPRDMWNRATTMRSKGRTVSPRNTKNIYLFGKYLTCGNCGSPLTARSAQWPGNENYYYFCPKAHKHSNQAHLCTNTKYFRAGDTDIAIWEWLMQFLSHPTTLQAGLEDFLSLHKTEVEPIKERVMLLNTLVERNRQQLKKIIDLYIEGKYSKEHLLERKNNLQANLTNLVNELSRQQERLNQWELTPEKLTEIRKFSEAIISRLDLGQMKLDHKRKLITALDVSAALSNKGNQQYAKVTFAFGSKEILITKTQETNKE